MEHPVMCDNTLMILPGGLLAIRLFVYPDCALYLLGDGRLVKLAREFPFACYLLGGF
jgi:hypothetical protein